MGLSPGLHSLAVGRPAEVVSALGRGSPASLAGGLAGLAASRLTAVPLVVQVARVGIVQLAAVAALASSGSDHGRLQNAAAHGGACTARTPATSCANKTQREENQPEEDRCAPGGKKTQPKKTAFSNRLNYHTFRTAMTPSPLRVGGTRPSFKTWPSDDRRWQSMAWSLQSMPTKCVVPSFLVGGVPCPASALTQVLSPGRTARIAS